jgi:hypothetical protein
MRAVAIGGSPMPACGRRTLHVVVRLFEAGVHAGVLLRLRRLNLPARVALPGLVRGSLRAVRRGRGARGRPAAAPQPHLADTLGHRSGSRAKGMSVAMMVVIRCSCVSAFLRFCVWRASASRFARRDREDQIPVARTATIDRREARATRPGKADRLDNAPGTQRQAAELSETNKPRRRRRQRGKPSPRNATRRACASRLAVLIVACISNNKRPSLALPFVDVSLGGARLAATQAADCANREVRRQLVRTRT